ncbi:hypothetical protein PGB90_002560 [Kerria lacca]
MRHHRSHFSNKTAIISCFYVLISVTCGIMVPTGKLTPIEPAEPLPSVTIVPSARKLPAPVSEYTADNPEPPPLDPSYVPIQYNYIQYLSPHAIVYVPLQLKKPAYVQNLDKYKTKYDKHGKLPDKILQKYQDYPTNLQKKYIHYYLTQSNKS